MTSLSILLKDIVKLEAELGRFEARFGVKSENFYAAIMRGDLEEFDALDEYRMAFIEWLALYETWLSFDNKYRQCATTSSSIHPAGLTRFASIGIIDCSNIGPYWRG